MRTLIISLAIFFIGIFAVSASGHTVTATTGSNVTCFEMCDGNINATVNGGTGPFSFSWVGPNGYTAMGANIDSLCAGSYSVIATDSSDMSMDSGTIEITEPPQLIASIYLTTPAYCGQCNGTAHAVATGGMPGYTYIWSDSEVGAIMTHGCPGSYTLTVIDLNNCHALSNVTFNDSLNITNVSVSTILPTCPDYNNGSISTTVIGGTPPYTYTWNNGQATSMVSGLYPGNWSVTITDSIGCTYSEQGYLNFEMTGISVFLDTLINMNCANNTNGSISVHAVGGSGGYSYLWSPGGYTTSIITTFTPATYHVTVTDSVGCLAISSYTIINTYNLYATVTTAPANCGNNGFASVSVQGVHPPFQYQWNDSLQQTTATACQLSPGNYMVVVTDSIGCTIAGHAVISGGCYNLIKGFVYDDLNQNCIKDSGEAGLQGYTIKVTPGNYYGYTNVNGEYEVYSPNMNNSVTVVNNSQPYYSPLCPANGTLSVNFSQLGDTSVTNNFGFQTDSIFFDLAVHPGWSAGHPGFPKQYWIYSYNNSPEPRNALIRFTYDSLLQYTGSTQGGIHFPAQHKIEWTLTNIPPTTSWIWTNRPEAYFDVPVSVSIYQQLYSCFEILPIAGDANPLNNTAYYREPVTGSHDPNSISVIPAGIDPGGDILLSDSVLFYTIHFQNNGNDTAFTVVVTDTLSPFLDPATIIPGASNHSYTFNLSGQGVLTFRFDHIMLPDSGTNEPASNGYLNYTVRQRPGNAIGTVIYNAAFIYFDFNPAVITNTAVNTIVLPLAINKYTNVVKDISIYPNPVAFGAEFSVGAINESGSADIEIFNVAGIPIGSYTLPVGKNKIEVNSKELGKGVFFVKMTDNTGSCKVEKLVIY